MEVQVDKFIKAKSLLSQDDRLLIGVSGGIDSMALLHYFLKRHNYSRLSIAVVSIDHMLRGEESFQDLQLVKSFCEENNIPFYGIRVDVRAAKAVNGLSSSEASRKERYKAFAKTFMDGKFTKLVLAHHGDDQIETVLMQITRGITNIGHVGIPYRRKFLTGEIIRPFLSVTKDDIKEYVHTNRIPYREDPSNSSDAYTRNRFRKQILPFLKQENPKVHEKFQHFTELLSTDNEVLKELSYDKLNKVMKRKIPSQIIVDNSEFSKLQKSLQRRIIQLILNYLYQESSEVCGDSHLDSVLSIIENHDPSAQIHLPKDVVVYREYENVYFQKGKNQFLNEQSLLLHTNESILLWNGDNISCSLRHGYELAAIKNEASQFYCQASKISLPLIVRTRRNGDRILQKGTGGTKKLKSLFIDKKIPISDRIKWPIVTDSHDEILWVPLLKKGYLEGTIQLDELYMHLEYKQHETN